MSDKAPFEGLFQWLNDATSYIALSIFLLVGVVSTFWTLVLKPLLAEHSSWYRDRLEKRKIDEVRPVLVSLGLVGETARVRDLQRLRSSDTGRPDEVLTARLKAIALEHAHLGPIQLGRQVSQQTDVFVDLRTAAMDPLKREVLADVLANSITPYLRERVTQPGQYAPIDKIVGLKEGNPLVTSIAAAKLQMPLALYRGDHFPRSHRSPNPADYFDGHFEAGERIILVDDGTFRGTTLIRAVQQLAAMKVETVAVFLLFEPGLPDARVSLKNLGIDFFAVITITREALGLPASTRRIWNPFRRGLASE